MESNKEFGSLIELYSVFKDEHACHQYLAAKRWADGEIVCPFADCGGREAYVFSDGIRYKCKKCRQS